MDHEFESNCEVRGQTQARALGPNVTPLFKQAIALWLLGRVDAAEALIGNAITPFFRDDAALHLLGIIAFSKGDQAKAIHDYRQAIAINGRIPAYHGHLGSASCDLEQLDRYYREYERLMAHWRAVLPVPMLDVPYEAR